MVEPNQNGGLQDFKFANIRFHSRKEAYLWILFIVLLITGSIMMEISVELYRREVENLKNTIFEYQSNHSSSFCSRVYNRLFQ